ncbi:MAG: SpoVT/AbrB protein [Chloroflexi bacterium]|nr:SpoVT/AbrB protein [Chloroflexota bacterium]
MRARIVQIGNSRGLRIPKTLLEECGITESVDLTVDKGRLIVEPVRNPREGWAEAARLMADRGEDHLLDAETPTDFDETEWKW